MANIDKILEVSGRIHRLRSELAAAEAELGALAGGASPVGRPRGPRKAIRGGGPSVSQRVLRVVVDSGSTGVARRDLLAAIGASHEAAIHSALKVHARAGRIKNDDGQWVATAEYVRQLQAPKPRPAADAFMGAP